MYTIHFNETIIKPTEDVTVINYFYAKDTGVFIKIRDTRKVKYPEGLTKITSKIDFYKKDNGYYIDISDYSNTNIEETCGIFISEGVDFDIQSMRDPIFKVSFPSIESSQSSNVFLQDQTPTSVMLGMFFKGTKIIYKEDNIAFVKQLTDKGWETIKGPKNYNNGKKTLLEAIKDREELNSNSIKADRHNNDVIEKLKEAKERGLGKNNSVENLLLSKTIEDPSKLFIFTIDEIKDLQKQKIIT